MMKKILFFLSSLGGNAKTLMFVNTSPADYNNAESNSSLSFASRCKDITNAVTSSGTGMQARKDFLCMRYLFSNTLS